jgi:septal ring factor EnvC (AmiA/AmiB activator)
MNEKNYNFFIVTTIICAVVFFTAGRCSVLRGPGFINGNGIKSNGVTEQLESSTDTVTGIESSLERINDRSGRVTEQLKTSLERNRRTEDQLILSRSRVTELETRLERINVANKNIEKQLEHGIDRSKKTRDNIEKLRIILEAIQVSYRDFRNINSLSGGAFRDTTY